MTSLDAVPRQLLTLANPKMLKSPEHGYLAAILHLAPATLSGFDVCHWASPGCIAACLNTAGHGGIPGQAGTPSVVQRARIQRTRLLKANSSGFWALLERELDIYRERAVRSGLKLAVRLNGTSDVVWERIEARIAGRVHANVMRALPDVRFYDYTKAPPGQRGELGTANALPPNYSLTFSLNERNERWAQAAWDAGWNVAVVLRTPPGAPLPSTYMGREVVDGDVHDLRFLDPPGVVVGLRVKGRNGRRDSSGFVREPA